MGLPDGGIQLTLDGDAALSALLTPPDMLPLLGFGPSNMPPLLGFGRRKAVFARRLRNALVSATAGSDVTVEPPPGDAAGEAMTVRLEK